RARREERASALRLHLERRGRRADPARAVGLHAQPHAGSHRSPGGRAVDRVHQPRPGRRGHRHRAADDGGDAAQSSRGDGRRASPSGRKRNLGLRRSQPRGGHPERSDRAGCPGRHGDPHAADQRGGLALSAPGPTRRAASRARRRLSPALAASAIMTSTVALSGRHRRTLSAIFETPVATAPTAVAATPTAGATVPTPVATAPSAVAPDPTPVAPAPTVGAASPTSVATAPTSVAATPTSVATAPTSV